MFGKRRGSSDADPTKAARINTIVDGVIRRYEAGDFVDVAELECAHPELMPELGRRLRALGAIKVAREQALRESRLPPPDDARDAWLEEDLEFLRRSLGNYEVLERIRYGGQGIVYRARQKGANRIVAIKVLLDGPLASDRQRHRFEREIELISRLRHPNIITLHDTGTIRGRHYFAMEFVDGQPIDDYAILHDLTPRETVRLFVKVCRAVSYAHQNGVIHRDLSPANVLVDDAGEPHVFDFGLAKDVWSSDDPYGYSLPGQVVGTLPYLSPEQAGGFDGEVDVRSDIYTLGVVLYELLTDGFPYPIGGSPQESRDAIINAPVQPLRKAAALGGDDRIRGLETINRDLETVLAKALAKEKGERYQSVAEFADDLERCLAGEAVTARVDNPLYLLRKTLRRYRAPAAVAAIVFATLAVSSVAVTTLWMQARVERDNAREATRLTYDLFDTALTDLDESVRPLAGGVAVRDKMIAGLADRLPQLESLVESDESLDAIATRLAEKQGNLAEEQGRRAQARRYFEAFLANSRRLAELEPSNDEYLDDVSRAYRKCAGVADNPQDYFERGIRFAEGVLTGTPERDAARHNLCQLHLAFGEHLYACGQFSEALAQFNQALDLCPAVDRAAAVDVKWYRAQAVATSRRGTILQKRGEGQAGIEDLYTSLQIRERIERDHPADTASRHDLMLAYISVASAERDAQNIEKAKALFGKAIGLGRLLRTMDPTCAVWGQDLFAAYGRLIRLDLSAGDLDEAETLCGQAFELARELSDMDTRTLDGMLTLSYAHVLRGRLFLKQDLPAEAYVEFEQAAAIRGSLLEDDPDNLSLRTAVAATRTYLGEAARQLGKFEEAWRHYYVAYENQRTLCELQPDVVEQAIRAIRSLVNCAVAHIDCKTQADDSQASELLKEAEDWLERLRASGKLLGWERDYEICLSAIHKNQEIVQSRVEQRMSENGDSPRLDTE